MIRIAPLVVVATLAVGATLSAAARAETPAPRDHPRAAHAAPAAPDAPFGGDAKARAAADAATAAALDANDAADAAVDRRADDKARADADADTAAALDAAGKARAAADVRPDLAGDLPANPANAANGAANAANTATAATTAPEPPPPDLKDLPSAGMGTGELVGSLLKMVLMLGVVVALAYLTLHKGLGKLVERQNAGKRVKVVERISLDAKRSLFLVELDGKQMLLAAGEGGVVYLRDVDPAAAPAPRPGFADTLKRAVGVEPPVSAGLPKEPA